MGANAEESPFRHIQNDKKRAYLTAYALSGQKVAAAHHASIDPSTPYSRQWKEDEEFQEAMAVAGEIAADILEDEARRRAIEGVRQYKFTKGGEPILHPETGEPYYEHSYSDTLLIVKMKMAGRFVDRKDVDVRGVIGRVDLGALPDAAVRRIAAGESIQAVLATLEGPGGGDAPVLEAEIVEEGTGADSDPDVDV